MLKNCDARFRRSAATLQAREAVLFKTLFELLGITRTDRIEDGCLRECAGALFCTEATVRTDRFDWCRQIELVLPLQAFLQLAPLRGGGFLIQLPIQDQPLGALR